MNAWSKYFSEAIAEASFRASVTQWRYRVSKDRINELWNIIETTERVRNHGVVAPGGDGVA
jgi:hypothetical protein